ncbi:MAG: GNAT family N-acetyltransferase, partial [Candidatus Micrarchaeota archaeon]|nr:GNAT family N-acetyltransferase [Candidatus Micrarchaeota archaeon]
MEVRVRFIRSKTELLEAANLIGKVIKATPYYGPRTKREEIRKYNRRNILSSGKKFIGAFSGKVLVGVTMVAPDEGTLWVDWRLVEKPYRRKGMATKMFRFTEAFARKKGIHKIWEDKRTN